MREPSGARLRKSLYSQRMLPAYRRQWRKQRSALASSTAARKDTFRPSRLGDAAAGHDHQPSECTFRAPVCNSSETLTSRV